MLRKHVQHYDWIQLTPVLAVLAAGLMIVVQPAPLMIGAMVVAITAALVVATIHPARAFEAYLVYLSVEGAVKIFSNYNPVVHVGSDLLLLMVFVRLFSRHEPEADSDPTGGSAVRRVVPLLIVFWMWVLLQFLNPWGLGLLPSLAAMKVYASPVLVFFIAGFLLKREELQRLPYLLVMIGLIMGLAAIIDGILGDHYLPRLHSGYNAAMMGRFSGDLYRPFGFTALPGGPGVWMVHTGTAAGLLLYQLDRHPQAWQQVRSWFRKPGVWKGIIGLFLITAVVTLLLCQVRSALIRFLILVLGSFAGFGWRGVTKWIIGIGVVGGLISMMMASGIDTSGIGFDPKRVVRITDRFTSLSKANTWKSAREGAWDGMVALSESTMLGIGLSRVGASSRIWAQQIEQDRQFGSEWSFADNVYRALFTEVGIGGLLAFLFMIGGIVVLLLQRGTREGRLVVLYCGVYLMTGFASEGILYQPDASFFWLYTAMALRSSPGGLV